MRAAQRRRQERVLPLAKRDSAVNSTVALIMARALIEAEGPDTRSELVRLVQASTADIPDPQLACRLRAELIDAMFCVALGADLDLDSETMARLRTRARDVVRVIQACKRCKRV